MAKTGYEKVEITFIVWDAEDVLTSSGENDVLSDIFIGNNKDAPWMGGIS